MTFPAFPFKKFHGVFFLLAIPVAMALPPETAGELLENGEFDHPSLAAASLEEVAPEGWNVFSSSPDDGRAALAEVSGRQAVAFRAVSYEGHTGIAQEVPVRPGESYDFQVIVSALPESDGMCRGQISIEWMDSAGKEIGERAWGPTWGSQDLGHGTWTPFEMRARAPEGAAAARFVITCFNLPNGGGGFAVDAAKATRAGRQASVD